LRILFIGDVVGRSGLDAIAEYLPNAILAWKVDLVIVNGENSAGSVFGITEEIYNGLQKQAVHLFCSHRHDR